MNPERIRTGAFFAAGLLLFVQFLLQQVDEGLHPSGIVLIGAAAIFVGLGILRIRNPTPARSAQSLGIVEFVLLVLVGVLALVTLGLAALVLF